MPLFYAYGRRKIIDLISAPVPMPPPGSHRYSAIDRVDFEDQVDRLQANGIAATFINSTLGSVERSQRERAH